MTSTVWADVRYRGLLAVCRRSRDFGPRYASAMGTFEYFTDVNRKNVAVRRIGRWLDCSGKRATEIFHQSLVSEAREEADTAYVMEDPGRLESLFVRPSPALAPMGPVLYVTCHLGSPILAYLYLRRHGALRLRMILRELDDENPVAAAKRRFGEQKTASTAALAGVPYLGTDAQSLFAARAGLLEGRPVFAAVDVPGDAVTRRRTLRLFDSSIVVAGGLFALAAMTGAAIQPVFAVRGERGLELVYGSRIPPGKEIDLAEQVAVEVAAAVRRFPGEWWLWPYVVEPS